MKKNDVNKHECSFSRVSLGRVGGEKKEDEEEKKRREHASHSC